MTLVGGREHIPIVTSNYQIGKLKGTKPTSAQLCKHKDGGYYIHIQVKDEAPKPINFDNVIGCDFGRTDIAVTSDHKKWSGREISDVRDKYSKLRANLQKKASKGTRSSRRRCRQLLKRLSGKEKRFQRHINHVISKTIVLDAKKSNSIVAIEDLTGIRERTNQQPRSKTERRRSNSWAFYQLRTFLEYKGLINGVEILLVSPRYSSQTCHACMHLGLRSGKRFKCTNSDCGWHGDESRKCKSKLVNYWRGCKPPSRFGFFVLYFGFRATEIPSQCGESQRAKRPLGVGKLTHRTSIRILGIVLSVTCPNHFKIQIDS